MSGDAGYESVDVFVVRDVRQIHEIDDTQCPICPFTREAYDSLAQTSPVCALPFNQDAYCRHDAHCGINHADIVK